MPYQKENFSTVKMDVKTYSGKELKANLQQYFLGKNVVICFEPFNNSCNADLLIGKGLNWYPIPSGQGKTFSLDGTLSWANLSDMTLKFKTANRLLTDCDDNPLPETRELIFIFYYLNAC